MKNLHSADVIYLNEWKQSKRDVPDLDYSKINRLKLTNDIVQSEVQETKKTNGTISNRAKVTNIRDNRRKYLESQKPEFTINTVPAKTQHSASNSEKQRIINLLQLAAEEDE